MSTCSIPGCYEPVCPPTDVCDEHVSDIPLGDPRLGPVISLFTKFLRPQDGPEVFEKFFFIHDGNGSGVPEVRQGIHPSDLPIEGETGPTIPSEPQEPL